jgi:hypothetical protein
MRARKAITRTGPPFGAVNTKASGGAGVASWAASSSTTARVSQITAKFLGQVLLDYLDILDDFIDKLPEGTESGKGFWQGAANNARYKTEIALGVREPDYPDHFKPLKSVQARRERVMSKADPSQSDPGAEATS